MTRAPSLALALALAAAPAAHAQSPARVDPARVDTSTSTSVDTTASDITAPREQLPYRVTVAPQNVTVGDRFRSAVFVSLPAGSSVELIVPSDTAGDVQAVEQTRAYAPDSATRDFRAVATLVAWRPGLPDSLAARLRITTPDGRARTIPIVLRMPDVRSVLPADTSKHRPRPPHDVYGPGINWLAVGLLALLAAVVLLLLIYLIVRAIRRRRARRRVVTRSARERALALLERARTSGMAEAGDWKGFYSLAAEALRGFAASVDARWSADLTTSELLTRMRGDGISESRLDPLAHVLRVADLAKFARRGRSVDDAMRDLDEARRWVETFAAVQPESAEAADAVETKEAA